MGDGVYEPLKSLVTGPSSLGNCNLENKFHKKSVYTYISVYIPYFHSNFPMAYLFLTVLMSVFCFSCVLHSMSTEKYCYIQVYNTN